MSEPCEPTEAERQAFAQQFREVLRGRDVDLTCRACGSDASGGFSDLAIHMIQDRHNPEGPEITGSVHTLLASCQKCGYIWMFDRDVIGDW